MTRQLLILGFLLPAFILLAGCKGKQRLFNVKGTVKYGEDPLPAGVIYFDPEAGKNSGPQGYAIIKDGQFDTAAEGGKGVTGGPYLIRIEGFDGKPGKELPLGKPIFTDFKKSLDLPKADSDQEIEVPLRKKKSDS